MIREELKELLKEMKKDGKLIGNEYRGKDFDNLYARMFHKKKQHLAKSYRKIFKAIEGLSGADVICQLECAKIDMILNTDPRPLIVIDGKAGRIVGVPEEKGIVKRTIVKKIK